MRPHVDTTRPLDLYAMSAWALLTALAVAYVPSGAVRIALGLPFVLFLPGYALVSALFPERHQTFGVARGEDLESKEEVERGIDPLERVALAFGLSIAVVPLIGLGLNFTPWGIRVAPVTLALTGFILVASAVAMWRRMRTPLPERFRLRFDPQPLRWTASSKSDKAITVALVVAVIVAAGALAYVLTQPRTGEDFTEFYILGPDGRAENYPTNLTTSQPARVILGIVNHEHVEVTYTARIVAEFGSFEEINGSRTFVSSSNETLRAWDITLGHEGRSEENVTFTLEAPGEYRVRFELERPDASENPYRRLHLFTNVTG